MDNFSDLSKYNLRIPMMGMLIMSVESWSKIALVALIVIILGLSPSIFNKSYSIGVEMIDGNFIGTIKCANPNITFPDLPKTNLAIDAWSEHEGQFSLDIRVFSDKEPPLINFKLDAAGVTSNGKTSQFFVSGKYLGDSDTLNKCIGKSSSVQFTIRGEISGDCSAPLTSSPAEGHLSEVDTPLNNNFLSGDYTGKARCFDQDFTPTLGRCATGTVVGNSLTGTSGNDCINGEGGNDKIVGLAGHDKLNGNDGNDLLSGGSGNDELTGGKGADKFQCGAGNDKITDFKATEGDIKSNDCEGVLA